MNNDSPVDDDELVELRKWCLEHVEKCQSRESSIFTERFSARVRVAQQLLNFLLEDWLEPEEDDDEQSSTGGQALNSVTAGSAVPEEHVAGLKPLGA